jgi:hypothetical protein
MKVRHGFQGLSVVRRRCVVAKDPVRDEPRDRYDRRQFGGILLGPAGGLARSSGNL